METLTMALNKLLTLLIKKSVMFSPSKDLEIVIFY